MNHNRYSYYLLLLLPALLFFSCSQEEMPWEDGTAEDSGIIFRVSMSETESRSSVTTNAGSLLQDGFHVTAFCPEEDASAGNALDMYLSELPATPLEDKPGYFGLFDQTSEQCVWPSARHDKEGRLKFFAFYPSSEAMRQSAEANSSYFGLENKSTKSGSTVTYDYRMKKFKIHSDITRHIDFVTATAEGTKLANGDAGLNLGFEHQLSRIVLKAWGKTSNDIEIAGIRIGHTLIESDFNFVGTPINYKPGEDNTTTGRWVAPQVKGCVEYIFHEGDDVVRIGRGTHASAADAASIMGNAGWAMLIPADYGGWNHKTNDQGFYFSVLLRVKENDESNTLVYPYVIGGWLDSTTSTDAMNVVFLSVKSTTGKVVKRLYRNPDNQKYYTDPGLTDLYNVPQGEEVRNYGWAAVPLYNPNTNYRWKAGYQYTYTLNYSAGVGVA